ncbi:MAG: hypothetical protein JW913_13540, partial [Chitinispirillaceae bacterium]|nr:hypothetical protein [Chitinispirillaceae bacterium]
PCILLAGEWDHGFFSNPFSAIYSLLVVDLLSLLGTDNPSEDVSKWILYLPDAESARKTYL